MAQIALFVAMCLTWFTVLLPNTGLARLRSACQPLSTAISRLERVYPTVDMVHVVLFSGVGLLIAMAFAKMRMATLVWTIVTLAAATELLQLWVPGRSAKFGDFATDIVGGVAGMAVGWCLMCLLSRKRSR